MVTESEQLARLKILYRSLSYLYTHLDTDMGKKGLFAPPESEKNDPVILKVSKPGASWQAATLRRLMADGVIDETREHGNSYFRARNTDVLALIHQEEETFGGDVLAHYITPKQVPRPESLREVLENEQEEYGPGQRDEPVGLVADSRVIQGLRDKIESTSAELRGLNSKMDKVLGMLAAEKDARREQITMFVEAINVIRKNQKILQEGFSAVEHSVETSSGNIFAQYTGVQQQLKDMADVYRKMLNGQQKGTKLREAVDLMQRSVKDFEEGQSLLLEQLEGNDE